MSHKIIQANSIHQFSPDRFCVTPELLGAEHVFDYSGKQVSVVLPTAQKESPALPRELSNVECYKWRTEGNVPLEYKVNRIKVRVAVGNDIAVPEEALKVAPRRDELFTKPERDRFDDLVNEQSELAIDSFRYWLSVLRWKAKAGHIGEPQVRASDHSSGGSALQDTASGHRFWLQPHRIVAQGSKVITPSEWQLAQKALMECKSPPIWFDFVFQGEQRINNHDLTGAVLSLAIALEALIRGLTTHHLSTQTVEPLIYDIVDRANFRSILGRIRKLTFWNSDWEKTIDFSMFNMLMDYRDRVMHSADIKMLNRQELMAIHAKVKILAYFVSAFLGKE
jgi:hypothetical protein